jgi:hypothetical protein
MTSTDVTPTVVIATPPVTRHRPIPLSRIVTTELRKMFDTRSGAWLLASIAILALAATAAVVAFSSHSGATYSAFVTAIGFPLSVVLPIIAILSVTGEWSQRSGLTTFTLVPDRSRVIAAKALACVAVAVTTMPLVFAIAAAGNAIAAAADGIAPVWNLTATNMVVIALGNVIAVLLGFMLGVLIRSSAGAVVAYFVYSFVLPALSVLLAASQDWFRAVQPWIDLKYAQGTLVDGIVSGQQWLYLGSSTLIWLVVPLCVGLALVTRAEVK